LVAGKMDVGDRLVGDVRPGEILWNVDDYWSWTTGARDVERLVDRPRDLDRMLDHEAVLDDRHRDPDRVRLLEAVGPEQLGSDLAGQEHHRDRVHHRVADRRHQVGRTRTTGPDRHPNPARRLRVPLRRVATAGLVAHEDV